MIRSFFGSATAKDTSFLFIGSIVSNLAGLILLTILTKTLTQSDFGLFVTALTFSQLLADIFELGINPATLTLLSSHNGEKIQVIKQSFGIKLVTGILVIFGSFVLAAPIANLVFKNEMMIPFIRISGIGAGLLILIAWSQNIFQAEGKFLLASILNTSTNVFRLLVLIVITFFGFTDGISTFFLFQIVLLLSLVFFGKEIFKKTLPLSLVGNQTKPLLNFGLPVGIGFALAALYSRLDQILVFSIAGEKEAAIYGLASRLILIVIYAVAAFSSAVVVRFASMEEVDFKEYFRKTWLGIFGLIGLIFAGIVVTPYLLPLIFGEAYKASIVTFQILAFGIIFFVLSTPFNNVILYRYKKNHYFFFLSLSSLILSFILLQRFIPRDGSIGAAIAMSAVYLIQLVVSGLYYLKVKHD